MVNDKSWFIDYDPFDSPKELDCANGEWWQLWHMAYGSSTVKLDAFDGEKWDTLKL
jgi:hypothetical protein